MRRQNNTFLDHLPHALDCQAVGIFQGGTDFIEPMPAQLPLTTKKGRVDKVHRHVYKQYNNVRNNKQKPGNMA
jgi:hypothetical protein